MGWVTEAGGEVHEGYVAWLASDGRATGGSRLDGVVFMNPRWAYGVDESVEPFDFTVPWAEVTGWRVQCECGWRGTTWQRDEATNDDPTEEQLDADHMLLPDGRTLEDVGHEEWKRHVQPLATAESVRSAAAAVRDAEAALDDAVAAARAGDPPATWEQIGRAVGISRQSAHERWARNPSPSAATQQLLVEDGMLTFRGARPTMQSRQMLEPSAPTSQRATRVGEEDIVILRSGRGSREGSDVKGLPDSCQPLSAE